MHLCFCLWKKTCTHRTHIFENQTLGTAAVFVLHYWMMFVWRKVQLTWLKQCQKSLLVKILLSSSHYSHWPAGAAVYQQSQSTASARRNWCLSRVLFEPVINERTRRSHESGSYFSFYNEREILSWWQQLFCVCMLATEGEASPLSGLNNLLARQMNRETFLPHESPLFSSLCRFIHFQIKKYSCITRGCRLIYCVCD